MNPDTDYQAALKKVEECHQAARDATTAFNKQAEPFHKIMWAIKEEQVTMFAVKMHIPVNNVGLGTWDCEDSPTGECLYDVMEDPIMGFCLVCGNPEERK